MENKIYESCATNQIFPLVCMKKRQLPKEGRGVLYDNRKAYKNISITSHQKLETALDIYK